MISSIRTWMFNKSLQKHQNYLRKKEYSGVNHCKSICLIANGNINNSREATWKYKSKLESHNKSVDTLFFYDIKDEIDGGYSRKDINWDGTPQHALIDSILSNEYDLLIFLHPEMEDHLRYLAILCNAKFKIGPNFKEFAYVFDLMIDITDFSNTDFLIKNIDQQLKILSS